MTLTFLGQRYQATTTEVAHIPTTQTGKYRGANVTFSAGQMTASFNRQLTYRGVVYIH